MLERFTPEAKKVIEGSLREALQLGCPEIRTEHILLALLRDAEGVPCRALQECSISPKVLRSAVMTVLRGDVKEKKDAELIREVADNITRQLLRLKDLS